MKSIFPLDGTRFVPAFKAGTRAQTMPPSGLFEKLQAFLQSPEPSRIPNPKLLISKHFLSLIQIPTNAF